MAGYVDRAAQTHGRVLTLFTTVVTDSVDTGMLLTYIYTSQSREVFFFFFGFYYNPRQIDGRLSRVCGGK